MSVHTHNLDGGSRGGGRPRASTSLGMSRDSFKHSAVSASTPPHASNSASPSLQRGEAKTASRNGASVSPELSGVSVRSKKSQSGVWSHKSQSRLVGFYAHRSAPPAPVEDITGEAKTRP